MKIKIEKIKVIRSNVIQNFDQEILPLTVIYGLNEKGKTSLVEGIIRSLFSKNLIKRSKDFKWILREEDFIPTEVEIIVRIDKENKKFIPETREKIDNILENKFKNIPLHLLKLIIVKSAEVEIAQEKEGIDKAIIQKLLSDKWIIQHLKENSLLKHEERLTRLLVCERNKISIKERTLGYKTGPLKDWDPNFMKLNQIDSFLEKTQHISKGKLAEINKQIEKKEEQKRKLIIDIDKKISEINNEISKMENNNLIKNKPVINEIEKDLIHLKNKIKELEEKYRELNSIDIEKKKKIIDEFEKNYQEVFNKNLKKRLSIKIYTISFLILLGFIIISLFTRNFKFLYPGFLTGVTGLIISTIYAQKEWKNKKIMIELEKLENEYRKIFNEDLSQTNIEIQKEKINQEIGRKKALETDIEKLKSEIHKLNILIFQKIKNIAEDIEIKDMKVTEFENSLNKIKDEIKKLESQIDDKKREKERLQQEKSNILVFSQNEIDKLRNEKEKLEKEERNLKSAIEGFLGISGAGRSWGAIMEMLYKEREECISKLREIGAQVIAGKLILQLLNKIEKEEDKLIERRVNSKEITDKIKKFTANRYSKLMFEGNELTVFYGKEKYLFKNLSTGAKEQILLALRFGIVEQILNEGRIFFILDDAFQYSDWERRKYLIKKVIEMVKQGWQVLYFSMDQNIKETFNTLTKENLPKDMYKIIHI